MKNILKVFSLFLLLLPFVTFAETDSKKYPYSCEEIKEKSKITGFFTVKENTTFQKMAEKKKLLSIKQLKVILKAHPELWSLGGKYSEKDLLTHAKEEVSYRIYKFGELEYDALATDDGGNGGTYLFSKDKTNLIENIFFFDGDFFIKNKKCAPLELAKDLEYQL